MKPDIPPTLPLAFACACAFQVFLVSCGSNPVPDETGPELPPPAVATDIVVPRSAKGRAPNMDQSTPEAVLATIKDIVATDALDSLRRLCKEGISTGSPVRLMCSISSENMDQIDKFRTWFASARLDSAAYFTGDTAHLPITLSPGDPGLERHALLNMLQDDGNWYLNDLKWKK